MYQRLFFSLSLMHIHIPNILGTNFLFVPLLGDASLWRFISLVYYLLFFSRQLFLPHSYFIMFFSFVTRGIVGTSILLSFDLNFFSGPQGYDRQGLQGYIHESMTWSMGYGPIYRLCLHLGVYGYGV